MKITLTPSAAGGHTFGKSATMSVKFDGIQGRWNGKCLTTRDGNQIHAPAWWTKQLPRKKLVGELWMGNNTFTECQSVVTRATADERWRRVAFMVFEGEVKTRGNIVNVGQMGADGPTVRHQAEHIIKKGGEGLVVIDGDTFYKIKPTYDAEAVVVGHEDGTGRNAGRCGALVVQTDEGIRFRVGTGLTDAERNNPPPVGSVITYTYSGTMPSGKPRFPAYLRVREVA